MVKQTSSPVPIKYSPTFAKSSLLQHHQARYQNYSPFSTKEKSQTIIISSPTVSPGRSL